MRSIAPATKRILDQLARSSSNRFYDLHKPPEQVRQDARRGLAGIDYASQPVSASAELVARLRP